MERIREEFFFDRKRREIWSRTTWCRRYVRDLNEEETAALILDDDVEVFVNHEADKLSIVPPADVAGFWQAQVRGHVAPDATDINLNDFEDGFCYVVQLWKAKHGRRVLLLSYFH